MNKNIALAAMYNGEDPPKGYRPLSVKEKDQWNKFIRYMIDTKRAGTKELDEGDDKTLSLLSEYKKINPDFSITPDRIPHIQYEMLMLKNGMIPDESGKFIDVKKIQYASHIPLIFDGRELSKSDGRIGSLTSMESYPIVGYGKPYNKMWGTDYNTFLKEVPLYIDAFKRRDYNFKIPQKNN